MIQTFHCPNCQAALDVEPASAAVTVRCSYCSSTIIVPESLRGAGRHVGHTGGDAAVAEVLRLIASGNKIAAIKAFREAFPMTLAEAKAAVEALERGEPVVWGRLQSAADGGTQPVTLSGGARRAIGCVVFSIVLAIGLSIVVPIIGGWFALSAVSQQDSLVAEPIESVVTALLPSPSPSPAATATPELAPVALRFGAGEGIGPGFFDDTRRIGVDREGRFYTGDYTGGRVQVFDAAGQFLAQWSLNRDDYPMIALAVDRAGTVYLLDRGEIQRLDGLTGAALGPLAVPGRADFRALAVAPDGSLLAMSARRLVRFDAQGNLDLDLIDPFAAISGFRTTHEALAVDGAGNIYVAGSDTLYKFDRQGRFVDQIGSRGDAPDQFMTSPTAIAVDGQGRLYANDFRGIRVFDAAGRYLGLIDLSGVSFGMVVDDENRLVVMDRNSNEVVVFDLTARP